MFTLFRHPSPHIFLDSPSPAPFRNFFKAPSTHLTSPFLLSSSGKPASPCFILFKAPMNQTLGFSSNRARNFLGSERDERGMGNDEGTVEKQRCFNTGRRESRSSFALGSTITSSPDPALVGAALVIALKAALTTIAHPLKLSSTPPFPVVFMSPAAVTVSVSGRERWRECMRLSDARCVSGKPFFGWFMKTERASCGIFNSSQRPMQYVK